VCYRLGLFGAEVSFALENRYRFGLVAMGFGLEIFSARAIYSAGGSKTFSVPFLVEVLTGIGNAAQKGALAGQVCRRVCGLSAPSMWYSRTDASLPVVLMPLMCCRCLLLWMEQAATDTWLDVLNEAMASADYHSWDEYRRLVQHSHTPFFDLSATKHLAQGPLTRGRAGRRL
jgi:hypothetical protein